VKESEFFLKRGGTLSMLKTCGHQDSWREVMPLAFSDVENDDYFGLSVAIDGGGTDRGAIAIFYLLLFLV
jgi:hypothetical protein